MSTCISSHGEYGEHTPPDADWCEWCGAFNEEAIVAERDLLRAQVAAVRALVNHQAVAWIEKDGDEAWILADQLRVALGDAGGEQHGE